MKKTIKFGKIDYLGIGKRTCPVEVDVELRTRDNGDLEFAASGAIWNHCHTDCYSCGQNLDTIAKYIKSAEFKEIYRLWNRWHLNTFKAGDPEQEAAVKKYLETNTYDYKEVCKYLDSVGLLVHNGYKYGTSWLTEKIEENDLEVIKKIIRG